MLTPMLKQFTEQLRAGQSLVDKQVCEAVGALVDEQAAAELKADFLAALASKGETTDEIAAFAASCGR